MRHTETDTQTHRHTDTDTHTHTHKPNTQSTHERRRDISATEASVTAQGDEASAVRHRLLSRLQCVNSAPSAASVRWVTWHISSFRRYTSLSHVNTQAIIALCLCLVL